MTKEENCTYQLVRNVLTNCGFSGKLPKTMVTIRWVQNLKKILEAGYTGYTFDAYGRIDNKWHIAILVGETLDRAVKLMLSREISAHGYIIMKDPNDLPPVHRTECVRDSPWVLNHFLPSRFKNQVLPD